MSDRMHGSRQGIALVLVLGAVVIVTTAATFAVHAVHAAQLAHAHARDERSAECLRSDCEALLTLWLAQHGAGLVTPPDAPYTPTIAFADTVRIEGHSVHCQALVWDAFSSVPAALAHGGTALPPPWSDLSLSYDPESETPQSALLTTRVNAGTRFPEPQHFQHWHWGEAHGEVSDEAPELPDEPALALVLGDHADARININTAPIRLLTRLQTGGTLDLDALRDARSEGTPLTSTRARGDGIRFVASSDRWHVLLSCEVDGYTKRWWLILAGGDEISVVQRYPIDG